MGKKDKVDPAEGAEVAPEYQAGVLAMARARMEASNADAEQGLAEAAAQTQRQRAAHAGLEEELAEVREDARDQYFFLQQQLDADFERIAALERRAVVDGVELDRAERHHKARLARSQASHEEAIRAQTRREEDARAALAAARKELSLPRPDDFVEEAEVEEAEPPPPAVEARKTSKWRAALVTPALERMLAPETLPAPPPAPDAASITAAAARYDFPTGDAYDRARAARTWNRPWPRSGRPGSGSASERKRRAGGTSRAGPRPPRRKTRTFLRNRLRGTWTTRTVRSTRSSSFRRGR